MYSDGKEWKQCGNDYLSKGLTTESEVADTEGSTATMLLQQCLNEECTVLGLPDSFRTLAGLRGTFWSGCLIIVSGQVFFVSR